MNKIYKNKMSANNKIKLLLVAICALLGTIAVLSVFLVKADNQIKIEKNNASHRLIDGKRHIEIKGVNETQTKSNDLTFEIKGINTIGTNVPHKPSDHLYDKGTFFDSKYSTPDATLGDFVSAYGVPKDQASKNPLPKIDNTFFGIQKNKLGRYVTDMAYKDPKTGAFQWFVANHYESYNGELGGKFIMIDTIDPEGHVSEPNVGVDAIKIQNGYTYEFIVKTDLGYIK